MSGIVGDRSYCKSGIITNPFQYLSFDSNGVACFKANVTQNPYGFHQGMKLATQKTTSVTDSAITIATSPNFATYGAFYIIVGRNENDTTARFCDRFTVAGGQSLQDLVSNTLRGSPASRSYSYSGSSLQVTMGSSGNYNIVVTAIDAYTV